MKTPRNQDYLAYIRELPCIGCDQLPNEGCEAAHVRIGGGGGMGLKPSDYRAVPLCHGCHARQHSVGERTFWREVGREPDQFIAGLIVAYMTCPRDGIAALEAMVEAQRSP